MDTAEALTLAILAINTVREPQATSPEDLAYLETAAASALETLVNLREWVIAQGEDLDITR